MKIILIVFLACGIIDIHYFENTINSTTECIVDLDSEMDVEEVLKKNGHYLNNQIVERKISTNTF